MAKKKTAPVGSIKHKDKRPNIPTRELRGFVEEAENKPMTSTFAGLLYARDPSLDPQLVWKGKDELDRGQLTVPCVPIYIQEKIHPHAIIDDIANRAAKKEAPPVVQADLFADFNGLDDFSKKVDFYHWGVHWSNRMILGDSLFVMTSLAEKEGLKGQVQMIYMDPPYGIKFGSNWQVSTRKRDVKDAKADDCTRQPEQIKAFRDTWEYGVNSYLTTLRDRFVVARELLTESGSIFVQIGDENVHLLRCLMDEVFGSENYCATVAFRKTTTQSGDLLPDTNDYLLWYSKTRERVKHRNLHQSREGSDWVNYDFIRLADGTHRKMTKEERDDQGIIPAGAVLYRRSPLTSASSSSTTEMPVEYEGMTFAPGKGGWKTNVRGFSRLDNASRLESYGITLSYRRYVSDFPFFPISNVWPDTASGGYGEDKVYVVQTNAKVIQRCMLMTTDPGDLVLDPTCGSGTTAYVAEQWGRRWITMDTSRVALALARTRLMAARYAYYLLADSPDGIAKEAELSGETSRDREGAEKLPKAPLPTGRGSLEGDITKGFVYKRVPHVTLKAIANNEEIDAIHAKWQEKLEPLRAELNKLLKQAWEEWQVPREAEEKWPAKAKDALANWWKLRCGRQKEIDESIARRADTETLYDQPYEDKSRIRVTGPFTVESLSPHRVLAPELKRPASEEAARKDTAAISFDTMILDNLRKAGVQNTKKKERLKFDRLEPYTGVWLHAAGDYTDADGKSKRAAVSIGPEHGTVSPQQVKEAAKEAVKGAGFDILLVCGFAFDPHVAEEAKQYGKLPVLITRMNPDLAMGDDLLKKTGAGNLFMVFGEPDVKIDTTKDGQLIAEVKGVDVYDPTTGEIRNSSVDDIACWFIDTNYNEESFFVRHAYFLGADEPYEKLKRALRAEIDESAWSALYSARSVPFDMPTTGKIAIKVINHYGDEVLKVFPVETGKKRK
jgi:adenine-specific DNA-methyltransferase